MLRIFTDTAANIPPHLLEQYHITAMPLTYLLDGQPTELVGHDYYEAMRKGAEVKTSLVSPALIRDTMESALKDGDDVLYIAISGGISGTCWSAELMAEELRGEYPDRMIRVLNTCGASLGEGLVVLEAAKMLEKGCTADEIIRQAEENCGRMRQFFMVDDLKYLRRGGRISAAAQVAGSLLKIKPILQSDPEGHIIQHSKVRGQLKAMETLAELYKEYAVDGTRTLGIAHADCPDGALRLQAKLRDAGQTGEILSVCYEPVTGGHVGPGTVALFFFGEVWR